MGEANRRRQNKPTINEDSLRRIAERTAYCLERLDVFRKEQRRVRPKGETDQDLKLRKYAALPPPELAGAQELVEAELLDPVGGCMHGRIRNAGWELFVAGGTAAMLRVANMVRPLLSANYSIFILDTFWDGIGNYADTWRAERHFGRFDPEWLTAEVTKMAERGSLRQH